MKPTIEQLQDALRRYDEGIQYLTENPNLSEGESNVYLGDQKIAGGICDAISDCPSTELMNFIKRGIGENYQVTPYWIKTPYAEERDTQIQLLTRRRDKLIEIIEKYNFL